MLRKVQFRKVLTINQFNERTQKYRIELGNIFCFVNLSLVKKNLFFKLMIEDFNKKNVTTVIKKANKQK